MLLLLWSIANRLGEETAKELISSAIQEGLLRALIDQKEPDPKASARKTMTIDEVQKLVGEFAKLMCKEKIPIKSKGNRMTLFYCLLITADRLESVRATNEGLGWGRRKRFVLKPWFRLPV